jgi:pimeloyl-ACP methyl ester carboxylesterase
MKSAETYVPRVVPRPVRHVVRDVDYRVWEWGAADLPLLVMLHGWGHGGSCFQFVVDELHPGYHVIAPDWRGFGESRLRSKAYWFPDYLADLQELLHIYSPNEPVPLLGHSMGGNVACLYAGIMPERVSALINVEGVGLADSDPADAPAHYRRWLQRGRQGVGYASYGSFDELAARIRKRAPRLGAGRARYVAEQWAEATPEGRVCLKADPAHRLPNAVMYRRAEAEACWARITARTVSIVGEDSEFRAAEDAWADAQPAHNPAGAGLRRVVVPESGHMVHFEQPRAMAAAVDDFLQAL